MTDHIQSLLGALEHGNREDVWESAKALSGVANHLVASLTRLLRAERSETRAAAAYVLGVGQFASARGSLEHILDDVEEDASVRGHAAEALAYIQATESVPVLVKHLTDHDSGVVYWCAFALGQIGDREAIPALQQLAERAGERRYDTFSLRAEALDAVAAINRHSRNPTPDDSIE
jgi:HEAT repeat protein